MEPTPKVYHVLVPLDPKQVSGGMDAQGKKVDRKTYCGLLNVPKAKAIAARNIGNGVGRADLCPHCTDNPAFRKAVYHLFPSLTIWSNGHAGPKVTLTPRNLAYYHEQFQMRLIRLDKDGSEHWEVIALKNHGDAHP